MKLSDFCNRIYHYVVCIVGCLKIHSISGIYRTDMKARRRLGMFRLHHVAHICWDKLCGQSFLDLWETNKSWFSITLWKAVKWLVTRNAITKCIVMSNMNWNHSLGYSYQFIIDRGTFSVHYKHIRINLWQKNHITYIRHKSYI